MLPPDLATLKRSRAAFTGAITKVKDKLNGIKATDIVTYNTKNIDRLITSISNMKSGFLQTMEDAQEFLTDGETDALQLEEDDALEAFSAAVLEVQDLADELLNLKSIRVGLDDLHCDVQALRDTFNVQPELNQECHPGTGGNLFFPQEGVEEVKPAKGSPTEGRGRWLQQGPQPDQCRCGYQQGQIYSTSTRSIIQLLLQRGGL